MSLYNILFGKCKYSDRLFEILELNKYEIGRFRDISLNEDGAEIVMLTRNGGGNREHYSYYNDEENIKNREGCDCKCSECAEEREKEFIEKDKKDCRCSGCVMEKYIKLHPNYLGDDDDDFDCTYAYVRYSVPEQYKDEVKAMVSETKENVKQKIRS